MTNLNKIMIIFISIAFLPITSVLITVTNNELISENLYINELQNTKNLCEDLNWEASSIHYELKSLDWYVGAMVNDSLMSMEEANNTIYKFIIENTMTPLEIEDRSGINDYSVFKNNPNILIEYYIIDLYDENYFSYNYTYQILISEYGENKKPFTIFFDVDIMENIVRQIEVINVSSLKKIQFYFAIFIGLSGFTITLLGIKEKVNCKYEKERQQGELEAAEKGKPKESLLTKRGTDFFSLLIFAFCLFFFIMPIWLFLIHFFF